MCTVLLFLLSLLSLLSLLQLGAAASLPQSPSRLFFSQFTSRPHLTYKLLLLPFLILIDCLPTNPPTYLKGHVAVEGLLLLGAHKVHHVEGRVAERVIAFCC
jgi:hypothetical protein